MSFSAVDQVLQLIRTVLIRESVLNTGESRVGLVSPAARVGVSIAKDSIDP